MISPKFGVICAALLAAGCTPPSENAALFQGPPIQDAVTPFDEALACLDGKITSRLNFAVGSVPDFTGKEQHNGVGTGKFVTQGAGDIIQSALFKTGVNVVNRRDIGSTILESQWGVRSRDTIKPAHLVITGSVNSLDFIPGGGVELNLAGVGPRYRQNRILVGLDLVMTNTATSEVVASISLHKQIFSDELGLIGTRVVDDTLIDSEAGIIRREALNFALRKMLQLATYELLTQMMAPKEYETCNAHIDERIGRITGVATTAEYIAADLEGRAPEDVPDDKPSSAQQLSDLRPEDFPPVEDVAKAPQVVPGPAQTARETEIVTGETAAVVTRDAPAEDTAAGERPAPALAAGDASDIAMPAAAFIEQGEIKPGITGNDPGLMQALKRAAKRHDSGSTVSAI